MDGASHVVKCINLNTTVNLPNQLKTLRVYTTKEKNLLFFKFNSMLSLVIWHRTDVTISDFDDESSPRHLPPLSSAPPQK